MKADFVSTAAIIEASRSAVSRAQLKLIEAQQEVATGQRADLGTSLGYKAGLVAIGHQQQESLSAIIDTNATASARLEASHAALKAVLEGAQSFLGTLLASRNTGSAGVLQSQSQSALTAATDALNSAMDGAYVFAGINSDVKPLANYFGDLPSSPRQAVADAFFAAFGVVQSDPAVAAITPDEMQNFLNGGFDGLFQDPAWSATWSAAADAPIRTRISVDEIIATSTTANTAAIQNLVKAYTMVADLGTANLNQETLTKVIETATGTISNAMAEITAAAATLGDAEQRVKAANVRLTAQKEIVARHTEGLEAVDPYEASTRINWLLTQLETSYAITARVQRLTLLDYL